jgi:hypothetical protein
VGEKNLAPDGREEQVLLSSQRVSSRYSLDRMLGGSAVYLYIYAKVASSQDEILMAVSMKIAKFWDVMPFSLVDNDLLLP